GERGGVRREHAVVSYDLLELCEDDLLDRQLLEDHLEDEVAVGKAGVVAATGNERGEKAALALVVASLRDLALDLGADVCERVVDDLLLDVANHDRGFEPAKEQECDLPRHQPGSDDADLPDLERRRS